MRGFSAIIAFYNEGENILDILEKLQKIPLISQIICVDDGSTDGIALRIHEQFPGLEILVLGKNYGKSYAIEQGLLKARNNIVLLMDADIKNLRGSEIQNALNVFVSRSDIDLLLLENKGGNVWIDQFINKNLFLSGQRVLRKKDLVNVYAKHKPRGYQLEVAINDYMLRHKKHVFHMRTSSFNPHKTQKYGFIIGLFRDLAMEVQLIAYLGFPRYARQLLYFGKEELA